VLVIFSFFTPTVLLALFGKVNTWDRYSLYLCLLENFLYVFEVLYTLFILEYRLPILTVNSHNTAQNRMQFLLISIKFSERFNHKTFFNGNGCFDILTAPFFINIKEIYLPDMLNMEIKTRNIWMFLKLVLNSMYMWTSYKAFPSLKKNKYVLNAHETKPYKIIKEKPHYCCSSSWDHCKPSAMKITCTKFQMLLIINDKKSSSYRVIRYRKKIFTNIVFFKYICNSNYLPLQHEHINLMAMIPSFMLSCCIV
jgi:hypothetical protein